MKQIISAILLLFLLENLAAQNVQSGIYMTKEDMEGNKLTPAEITGVEHGPGFQLVDVKIDGKRKSFSFKNIFGLVNNNGAIYRTQSLYRGYTLPFLLVATGSVFVWDAEGEAYYFVSETLTGPMYKMSPKDMDKISVDHTRVIQFYNCYNEVKKGHKYNAAVDGNLTKYLHNLLRECANHGVKPEAIH